MQAQEFKNWHLDVDSVDTSQVFGGKVNILHVLPALVCRSITSHCPGGGVEALPKPGNWMSGSSPGGWGWGLARGTALGAKGGDAGGEGEDLISYRLFFESRHF